MVNKKAKVLINGLMSNTDLTAIIESSEYVSDSVRQVLINIPDVIQRHQAGQYLMVKIRDKWSAFSIANAIVDEVKDAKVGNSAQVELHVGMSPGSDSEEVWEAGRRLDIQYPMGDCVYQPGDSPLLLVAGGTGFSQVKALLEVCITQNRAASVVWLGKGREDFYLQNWLTETIQGHDFITAVSLVLDHREQSTDLFQQAFLDQIKKLSLDPLITSVYLAGAPPMVKCLADALEQFGFKRASLKSDIFDLGL